MREIGGDRKTTNMNIQGEWGKAKQKSLEVERENKESFIKGATITAIAILLATALSLIPTKTVYSQEGFKLAQYVERGGCAWENCPDYILDKMLADHNGLYPPNYYENQSWDWIRSFCTYNVSKCK